MWAEESRKREREQRWPWRDKKSKENIFDHWKTHLCVPNKAEHLIKYQMKTSKNQKMYEKTDFILYGFKLFFSNTQKFPRSLYSSETPTLVLHPSQNKVQASFSITKTIPLLHCVFCPFVARIHNCIRFKVTLASQVFLPFFKLLSMLALFAADGS